MTGLEPSGELVGIDLSIEQQILVPLRVVQFALDADVLIVGTGRRTLEPALDEDQPSIADGGQAAEPQGAKVQPLVPRRRGSGDDDTKRPAPRGAGLSGCQLRISWPRRDRRSR